MVDLSLTGRLSSEVLRHDSMRRVEDSSSSGLCARACVEQYGRLESLLDASKKNETLGERYVASYDDDAVEIKRIAW